MGFTWKNKEINTIGELGDAAVALENEIEGLEFVLAALSDNPHALENIGYVAGYYDSETCQRIWRLTNSNHPIFGKAYPSPGQAYDLGEKYDN